MKLLYTMIDRFKQAVWEPEAHSQPWWQAYAVRWIRIVWLLTRELTTDGQLSMRAMSLVYTTLLSLVPLLAVSFSVLKAFGVQNQVEPVLLNFLDPLGQKGVEITTTIIGFVDNMRVGVLGSVGLGLLLYTVISLVQKVERTFNYTWQVSQNRPFVERFSDYLSVLLIGPVLVFSALGATASVLSTSLVLSMAQIPVLGWIIESAGKLLPYVFVISAFTFVYTFVPNTRVRLGPALIGAMVAGVLWQSIGWGFASFVVNSTKYAAIYSGFAILILFMIWLYLAWLILLIGASIAFYHQHPEYLSFNRAQALRPGNRMREWIGLQSMCLVAQLHFDGSPAPTVEQLATKLGVRPDPVEDALSLLRRKGLVVATQTLPETYLPGQAPERICVQSVLDSLRRADEQPTPVARSLTLEHNVTTVFTTIEQATMQALQGQTIRDLVLGTGSLHVGHTGNGSPPHSGTTGPTNPIPTEAGNKEMNG